MPKTSLPFTNGFYVSDSLPLSAQECLNLYVNIPQAPALNTETLFGTPGTVQLATAGDVVYENRGMVTFKERAYFVNGPQLFRYNLDGTLDTLGAIAGTDPVSIAVSSNQLVILEPGGVGYVFTDDPDTLVTITNVNFRANGEPQYCTFIDGYFVFTTDEDKFIVSAINDATTYDALFFGSAESNPDPVVAPFAFKGQLFIAGSRTIEAEQNIGGADFPYQRSGLFLDKGVAAPLSFVAASDTFMWIGGGKNERPAVWAFAGNSTTKVSTTAIDNLLQDLTESELTQVRAWSYAEKGGYFVGFRLPTTTIVLDTATGRWGERKSLLNGRLGAHRVSGVISAYNMTLVGDALDGRIGEMRRDVYKEYDAFIVRRITTQPFINNMDRVYVPEIELTVESGVGNADSTDPTVEMDYSKDGKTFEFPRARPLGKIGEYDRRAVWRRNGRFGRMAVIRFTTSDPVKVAILMLTAEVM